MAYAGLELVQKESGFYFELPALAETHDPKGADMAKLATFIERHGLTESKLKKYPVWAALPPCHCNAR